MFVRVKTSPGNSRKAVQIVESVLSGKKVSQRIVRHIGVAWNDAELGKLMELGEVVKADVQRKRQRAMLAPEDFTAMTIKAQRAGGTKGPSVAIEDTSEECRVVTGIHEAHGAVYRQLGFDGLLPTGRNRSPREALHHMVMARIANPNSKRGTVRRLEAELGVSMPVQRICRMMDRLDGETIECMKGLAADAMRRLLPEPPGVVYFDCTPLHLESVDEYDLPGFDFSKNGRHGRTQVLLALMATSDGLPLSCEMFTGLECEEKSLIPSLERMREREQAEQAIHVTDRVMFGEENLKHMEERGLQYIASTPLEPLPRTLKERILDLESYWPTDGPKESRSAEFEHNGRRLVVGWSRARAKRGADARWDGLKGIITNVPGMEPPEVLARHRELRQVEGSFRITEHDLELRPEFDWTPERVKAHIAIAYMAFACVRHLAYRVALQQRERMSPERVRQALVARQCSIMRDGQSGRRFALPSTMTPDMERICRTLGLPISRAPYWIE